MNEEKLKKTVKKYLLKCRPGDWNHSLRVVEWVKQLGKSRDDIDVLIASAYLHDIGWYQILPNDKKLSKKELKELEPQANKNTIPMVKKVLGELGDSSIDIDTVIRLIDSTNKHKSSSEDESIIVDADNISKLNIDHVREKYQKDDWMKMYELWRETFANRIKTTDGKKIYTELLKRLKKEVDKRMKVQEINCPLKSLLWKNDSEDILIIVGGSSDDRFEMKPLVEKLIESEIKHNILTFSFKGVEEDNVQPLKQQVEDLKTILERATEEYEGKIDIACTSMGAYSTSHALVNDNLSHKIHSVIFIDPADYCVSKDSEKDGGGTWNGLEEYKPQEVTSSKLLTKINSNTKVHVINFLLKNYTKSGYVAEDKRHIDNPECFPRLNSNMVKSFYKNTPDKNKGKYIEDTLLPHAFVRDGDLEKNVERLASSIIELLKQ